MGIRYCSVDYWNVRISFTSRGVTTEETVCLAAYLTVGISSEDIERLRYLYKIHEQSNGVSVVEA